nr:integrase, catalytic region, zinc finger, CCHC-type, peptidase aspartic, catalytic [Tanacetum cinerariifolium]
MANLLEDIECAGSDTRPPMLDRTDFTSWQQRIRLYCQGKENGVNILKSIDEGPFQMGMFREILAEGEEGTELIKEDRESQLYDDFEHFRQHKGETIHDNYVWFSKLINDMRNIKMTMSKMQLNSKFVNNMLPEWGRFVTTVKLNRGLRDSNYDQLYAYLKQHEAYANENKMMLDRFTQHTVDPLTLMSHLSRIIHNHLPLYHPHRGQGNNARGTGAAGYEGAHNRVGNANSGQARQIKYYNYNGIGHIARNCTQPKRPQNSEYFKNKMFLMQAQENRVTLDEEQLLFIAGRQDNVVDEDVDEQPVQELALNVDNVFQADDYDAFDFDVDNAPTAQTMFMANLSSAYPVFDEAGPSYDLDILSEVHNHDHYHDTVCEHHEVHEMHNDVQPNYVVDSHADYTSHSNMIPYDQYVKENTVPVVQSNVSSVPNDAYMMILNDIHEQPAQHVFETTRNNVIDKSLAAELAHIRNKLNLHNSEETLEIAKITRKKMNDKMKDPECVQKKVKIAPHNYSKENYLATFTPQQLTPKQIFSSKDLLKMKEEALKEQTIASKPIKSLIVKHDEIERKNLLIANDNLIADCLSKYVFYTAIDYVLIVSRFSDMHEALNAAQKRIAELEFKNSNLKNKIQNDDHDVMVNHFSKLEVEHLNLQLKYQHLKESFENKKSMTSLNAPTFDSVFVIGQLKDQVQRRGNTIRELREKISQLKKKHSEAVPIHDRKALDSQTKELHAKINALHDLNKRWRAENKKVKRHYKKLYAIDVEPIPPRIRNNREVHLDYLKHLKESVKTVCEIVEEAKAIQIVLWYLDSGCSKHMTGDRSRLWNFVKKFIGTVRFGNDHFGAIMGYGDYVIGDSVISRVYYMEGLGQNLFSIRQFWDSDLEVAFRKHSCYVRDMDGVELIKGSRGYNLYTISVEDMMKSSPIFPSLLVVQILQE